MDNVISFIDRVRASADQGAGPEAGDAAVDRTLCPIDLYKLLQLPIGQWPAELEEIERHLRTIDDPRMRSIEEAVKAIGLAVSTMLDQVPAAAKSFAEAYQAITRTDVDT